MKTLLAIGVVLLGVGSARMVDASVQNDAAGQVTSPGGASGMTGQMAWNSMPWNSMPWNSMPWNSLPWNGIQWNGIGWNSVSPDRNNDGMHALALKPLAKPE